MLQYSLDLTSGDSREPREKVIDRGAVFDVIKESSHGHPRATEDPGTADFARLTFHFRTVVPVTIHDARLPRDLDALNPFRCPKILAYRP